MKEKKERNSSIELLRIICMIFIVAHHFSVHGNFDIFTVQNISGNTILVQILSIWGKMACNIFMLITGYFMIKSKFNLKKCILLMLEMIFYSIGIIIIFSIFNIRSFSIKEIIKSCLSIFYGNWFLINYLIIYCLVPFLNNMIKGFDNSELKKLIYVLIVIFSIIPTFALNSKFEFNNIDIMIIMYIIGAYIGLYTEDEKNKKYTIGMILFNGILICSVIGFDILGIVFEKNSLIKNATYFSKINSIIVVGGAISSFLYFLKNKKFSSNMINFIASAVLGVYLIHDNEYIREYIWEIILPNKNFIESRYFMIFALVKITLVFVICVIIDKIRYYIVEKNFEKILVNKIIEQNEKNNIK